MEADERHHNPMGSCTAAIYCDLAVQRWATPTPLLWRKAETFTTIELKINFLRAVRKATLTAEARVVKSAALWDTSSARVKDQTGKLVAKGAAPA